MKWTIGSVFGLVLAIAILIAGSVWIEHRHPYDDPARAWFPRTQRLVTGPIVVALGRQIQSHYRRQIEAKYMKTGLSLRETIERFLDEGTDLAARRDFAFRLAREGTPEALAALQHVLGTASPADLEHMLWLIGRAGNPATIPLLESLVRHTDESVARAAIRALGLIGNDTAVRLVADLLANPTCPEALRIEAAVTLGTVQTTTAQLALTETFARLPSGEVASEILHGLGRYDFDRVAPVFRSYLSSPTASGELRIVAVEALAKSSADAVPFLLEVARADTDPEVRASAAWAISTHQTAERFGNRLTEMAEDEAEVEVRRRLYEAMVNQSDTSAGRIFPLVLAEEDTAARIAGLNALGASVHQDPSSSAALDFDERLVPELQRLATSPNSLNLQIRAVFALRRAGTPAAREALARIESDAPPQVASAARNGLRAASP
ncbi:HEAT repeat domain-containing protein [Luteolibacter soli]|uniref:HEAT repeat domain-containing protein n=1 Tax=Luteolibacter soli TaxID=3135280 RepID=A0ABU9AZL1_9BACT